MASHKCCKIKTLFFGIVHRYDWEVNASADLLIVAFLHWTRRIPGIPLNPGCHTGTDLSALEPMGKDDAPAFAHDTFGMMVAFVTREGKYGMCAAPAASYLENGISDDV